MDIPVIIDEGGNITGENDFMTRVIKAYSTYQARQTELSDDYEALMEVIQAQVDAVTDVDTANQTATSLARLQHIFDSKLQAGQRLKKRCQELGLKFNKVKKQYEAA